MDTQCKGEILKINPIDIKSMWEKQTFQIKEKVTAKGQKANIWQLEVQNGDCRLLNGLKAGDNVLCHVTITGTLWSKDGKDIVFNTLKCTHISKL